MNHCALLLPFAALICVPSIAETVLLHSFEDPDCATSLRANNTRIGLVSDRKGVPVRLRRRVAGSKASRMASPQLLASPP